ncbi:L-histidine N(alpha)-methyltransferase [Streptomyces sp. B1866]|uniref:L-histidine N(alpha)-methyltransferase n=1 Tax=Streptomyces sp. B1866 TaxID=3075431 RepID=UPI002891B15B|nr:L-histidine N(alpha)-methyltransferase [Streptomyces sp. B1866]MDT3396281.1 L-histidine N(alpha)-methyltransferase [Streptomyces sp. B1866]
MAARDRAVQRLEGLLDEQDFSWSLCLVGEDQSQKFAQLAGELREPFSRTGDGKRISSGFSYWGVESTMAWIHACSDLFYPVMRESIESFTRRWARLAAHLDGRPFHYVSLGTGTGHKDHTVLSRLGRDNPGLCYLPVDVSPEMLRLSRREALRGLDIPVGNVVPVQLDFSSARNMAGLRGLVERLVGDEPVVYSLLGNTLANFPDDTALLDSLTSHLLRRQDRFLLEVASTDRLDHDSAAAAAREYRGSPRFGEFVTSAVMQYTDLHIDMDSVSFDAAVEDDRALLVKVVYRNRTGEQLRLTLPDRSSVEFPPDDTIRLLLTRKYLPSGLEKTLADAGVSEVDRATSGFTAGYGAPRFGMELVLLQSEATPAPGPVPPPNPFA